MKFDENLVAAKLRRWEKYLRSYRLPAWEEIPDFGLYMEQVIALLKEYLDYLPPELKEEQFITAATINNYVRIKIMPGPVKRRYYRIQIAYLIVICSLKTGMSLALIQKILPMDIPEEGVKEIYETFIQQHADAGEYFAREVRGIAGKILSHEEVPEDAVETTEELIVKAAVAGSYCRLMSEKLLLLDGRKVGDEERLVASGKTKNGKKPSPKAKTKEKAKPKR